MYLLITTLFHILTSLMKALCTLESPRHTSNCTIWCLGITNSCANIGPWTIKMEASKFITQERGGAVLRWHGGGNISSCLLAGESLAYTHIHYHWLQGSRKIVFVIPPYLHLLWTSCPYKGHWYPVSESSCLPKRPWQIVGITSHLSWWKAFNFSSTLLSMGIVSISQQGVHGRRKGRR